LQQLALQHIFLDTEYAERTRAWREVDHKPSNDSQTRRVPAD
jgi:hypothetical protein